MDFPPTEPRDYVGSASFPDVMNDPTYATNVDADGREKGIEEPDTCRICRGEGSEEDQLFYPCKCSGSIKFVHQSCLVEWLSHSQKKYCELCKTPFRFTKLYDPNMPRDLPAPLFLRQLAIHCFHTVVTWLRFVLVAFVWLGWLPWSMRAIWRALFWLADGRWPGGSSSQPGKFANGTTLADTVVAATSSTVSTAATSMATGVPSTQSSVSSMFTYSTDEPMMLTLIKKGLSTLFSPVGSSSTGLASSNITAGSYKPRHPSWLSDLKILTTLTPSPTINNIIIDTLEGQLITLLVVVSFILVFLIREWVVQQQPLANIAEGEREVAVQLVANNRQNQEAAQPQVPPQPVLQPEEEFHNEGRNEHTEHPSDHEEEEEILSTHGRQPFRDTHIADYGDIAAEGSGTSMPFALPGSRRRGTGPEQATDESRVDQVWDTFRDLWARGGGNPDQILSIIREEGRDEELDWIVALMARLQRNRLSQSSSDPIHVDVRLPDVTTLNGTATGDAEDGSSAPLGITRATYDAQPESEQISGNGPSGDTERSFGPRFGEGSGTGSPQHAFTFNFREPGPAPPEDVETEPGTQSSSNTAGSNNDTRDDTQAHVPANTTVANDAATTPAESQQQPSQTQQPLPRVPRSLADKVFDWFWADITPEDLGPERPQQDDEHIVVDPELEAPFIPVQNNGLFAGDGVEDDQDEAAGEAGIDPNDVDAIEEADDLEGILELIGMQGPIFGLLQNGVFSALLISLTVALGIWLPYLWGKIALVLLANPVELIFGVPMTAVSVVADITLDTLVGSLGYVMYTVSILCKLLFSPFSSLVPLGYWVPRTKSVTSASLSLIDASSHRLSKVANAFLIFHESDVPMFSVISHQALKIHQARVVGFFQAIFALGKFALHDLPLQIISLDVHKVMSLVNHRALDFNGISVQAREQIFDFIRHPYVSLNGATSWVRAGLPKAPVFDLSSDLALWNSKDRTIAIIMGYALASVLGLLYLRITGILSGVNRGQRIEGLVADILHQAGGVMKVILIIGIEMIVFPLYCGSLLDVALMPLFENATIASRIEFTSTSPLTSLFVHWFIGTCYMFHFALFVSMCRKIMRSGVLYFIRDPDDPTFHPVRDVLERNITTQLRKIAFSAMVYGALVIICLGGVVWGIYYAFDGVLPVHWSATAPVLEFPVDLLFYNFVMPLAIKSIKPSDGLHNLYAWWFHRCARFLRLTNFFFGQRQADEEGHHVRRTWWDFLSRKQGDLQYPVIGEEHRARADQDGLDAYFLRDGRFVRAPSSDQVRIPKGSQVFLEVTEDNKRVDGAPDSDSGLHGSNSDMFTKVYIPPFFRVRIAAFILSIWAFAAVTGVGITVLPLVTGRKILSTYFSSRVPLNDIYCFSAGMCVVGIAAYAMFYCRASLAAAKDQLRPYVHSPRRACVGVFSAIMSALRLLYVFTAFSVLFPSLVALVLELYVLIPMHTYFGRSHTHVIHFVQDWTLGVLYVQMTVKFMLWNSTTRPASALKCIFRDDWLKPDVLLATRALVLPFTLAVSVAVVVPLAFGFFLNSTVFASSPDLQWKIYRYAYPCTFFTSAAVWVAYMVRRQVDIWRVNVRDDVYLIGERLHNFSDRRAKEAGASRRVGA